MATLAEEWVNRGRDEGRQEGELSGELKGERASLIRLLEFKFGHVCADVRSRIDNASKEQIERYQINIFHAQSPEDVVLED